MFQIKGTSHREKKSFKHNGQFYIELCQRTKNGVNHSPKEKGKFQEDHKMKPLAVREDRGLWQTMLGLSDVQ